MTTIRLEPMTYENNAEDALDLATRAADYVALEVGHLPTDSYIKDFFHAVPPDLGLECLMHFSVMQDTAMVGMICIAEGYEFPTDWWVGLVLLDPAYRGRNIGHQVVIDIKHRAAKRGILMLKLAVLEANPRALQFWAREGFVRHRYAPATPDSDGHDRVVLKYRIKGG